MGSENQPAQHLAECTLEWISSNDFFVVMPGKALHVDHVSKLTMTVCKHLMNDAVCIYKTFGSVYKPLIQQGEKIIYHLFLSFMVIFLSKATLRYFCQVHN